MAQEEERIITRKEGPNQVIHIRSDSNGLLEALFQPANNKSRPLRERKLPESFFIQHLDRHVQTDQSQTEKVTPPSIHVRSRSLPASIQPSTLSLAPQCSSPTVSGLPPSLRPSQLSVGSHSAHTRQKSVPASQTQLYNPVQINVQWKAANLADGRIVFQSVDSYEVYPDSESVRDQIVGVLPKQYEARRDGRGETYYIDHANCTTSWFDPRLPKEVQEAFVHNRNQQTTTSQQFNTVESSLLNQLQQSSRMQEVLGPTTSGSSGSANLGHPQNHHPVNRDSSFPPTIFGGNISVSQPVQHQSVILAQQSPLPQQQISRLQQLEQEREMMKLRQKELQSQILFKQQLLFNDPVNNVPSQPSTLRINEQLIRRQNVEYEMIGSPVSPLTNMRANDPFLNSQYHGRQESGDSGFCVSTPHTPENFLSQTMDRMDELSLYPNDNWDAGNSMDITVGPLDQQSGSQHLGPQDPLLDAPGEINDFLFSEIESVLMRDGRGNQDITWL